MRILVIGDCFSRNLGDQLLCRTVENVILQNYPGADVRLFDMSGKTGYDSYYEPTHYSSSQLWYYRIFNRMPFIWKRAVLLRGFSSDLNRHMHVMSYLEEVITNKSFDLAIFAGGSIFMDHFAAIIHIIVKRLAKARIPIMFHACGMSTLSKDSVKLIQRSLKCRNIKWISLRDSYQRFCDTFKTKSPVTETNDTALYCSAFYAPAATKQAEYGVGIMDIAQYYPVQKEIVRWFRDSGKSWKLFTNGNLPDRYVTRKIMQELGIPEDHLCESPENPEDFVKTITGFDRIVSFRMHTQIVAASFGIPVYGLVWNAKITEMFSKMDLDNNCCKPEQLSDLHEVCKMLEAMDKELLKGKANSCGSESAKLLLEGIVTTMGSRGIS